jgi:ubiquinone/menaquinone biosynthesis C-methylase UbiE
VSFSKWREIWGRFHGRGTYPHELAFLLKLPMRSLILSPRKLAARLHLQKSFRVLEVGPGPGFFSVHIARSVPAGRLELFDIQHEMLEKARTTLSRAGVGNIGFTQGSGTALPYRKDSFDVAFLVAVLGEVPDPGACVESIRPTLRAGGILSITELPGDPDALPQAEVCSLAEKHGLSFLEEFATRRGFTMNFEKPASDREPSDD